MDTMVVVALLAYAVLFCMSLWVVQTYIEESKAISKQLKSM